MDVSSGGQATILASLRSTACSAALSWMLQKHLLRRYAQDYCLLWWGGRVFPRPPKLSVLCLVFFVLSCRGFLFASERNSVLSWNEDLDEAAGGGLARSVRAECMKAVGPRDEGSQYFGFRSLCKEGPPISDLHALRPHARSPPIFDKIPGGLSCWGAWRCQQPALLHQARPCNSLNLWTVAILGPLTSCNRSRQRDPAQRASTGPFLEVV